MAVGKTQKYPDFDPTRLGKRVSEGGYTVDEFVYCEQLCACGGILRIRGEVSDVARFYKTFMSNHSGAGHEETNNKVAVARAREQKRYDGFVTAAARDDVDNAILVEQGVAKWVDPDDDDNTDVEYVRTSWTDKNFDVKTSEVFKDWSPERDDEEVVV